MRCMNHLRHSAGQMGRWRCRNAHAKRLKLTGAGNGAGCAPTGYRDWQSRDLTSQIQRAMGKLADCRHLKSKFGVAFPIKIL
jgi:hypothetical protein